MRVTVSGVFNANPGDVIKIEEGYENSTEWITAQKLENVTSGATANFGRFGAVTQYIYYNPHLIARVSRVTQTGGNTELEVDKVTKEVFLSYSSVDRVLAGSIATGLEAAGLSVVQAHAETVQLRIPP
jgi:hypothetical protein